MYEPLKFNLLYSFEELSTHKGKYSFTKNLTFAYNEYARTVQGDNSLLWAYAHKNHFSPVMGICQYLFKHYIGSIYGIGSMYGDTVMVQIEISLIYCVRGK